MKNQLVNVGADTDVLLALAANAINYVALKVYSPGIETHFVWIFTI